MSSDVEKLGGLERILLEYMKTQCALIQSESLLLSKWLFKTKTISSHRMLVYNKKGVFSCLLSFFWIYCQISLHCQFSTRIYSSELWDRAIRSFERTLPLSAKTIVILHKVKHTIISDKRNPNHIWRFRYWFVRFPCCFKRESRIASVAKTIRWMSFQKLLQVIEFWKEENLGFDTSSSTSI
jgi:hypothetical protein